MANRATRVSLWDPDTDEVITVQPVTDLGRYLIVTTQNTRGRDVYTKFLYAGPDPESDRADLKAVYSAGPQWWRA